MHVKMHFEDVKYMKDLCLQNFSLEKLQEKFEEIESLKTF